MADMAVPLALRRPRRGNVGPATAAAGPDRGPGVASRATRPPATPRRRPAAVRFSDPGPAAGSGLTPMLRRACIDTPRARRASAPGARAARPSFSPSGLRQTADGRVQRRIRRANLRDLVNRLEQQKRRGAVAARAEIGHLHAEIKARDREIYQLQNATIVDMDRIWDLEQVDGLREELRRREAVPDTPRSGGCTRHDWTLAARDPFVDGDDDVVTDLAPDEDHFGDVTMAQLAASTPSRARSSFPTPPATSPAPPATPCRRASPAAPHPSHAAVQACFPDPDRAQRDEELASLQLEVRKLAATLESYRGLGERVADRLSSVAAPFPAGAVSGVDALERQVEGLVRAMSHRTAALAHLTSSIADLGFPGRDAADMLTALAAGFRAARLELEYLTPGEVVLPLTSHGAEVLDLLLGRLRLLAKRVQEDEATIDEYHEIEQSLRKQLDARVSVIEGLKQDMAKAEGLIKEKNAEGQELRVGNRRLKSAVDGYVRDIAELEKLVERIEGKARALEGTHRAREQSDREALAASEASVAELEGKLADAMRRTSSLQMEMSRVQDNSTKHVVSLNRQHGAALALRDARVLELHGEIDRLNESLRTAHDTIRELRLDRANVEYQMRGDRQRAKDAVGAIKGELQRVLHMSHEFLDEAPDGEASGAQDAASAACPPGMESRPAIRAGGFLAAAAMRPGAQKTPARRDSAVALLHGDEVDI